jgi:adenosine deaminase CECR1
LNSIRLDKPHEGRNELFGTHWQRLNDMAANPFIIAEMIVKNMQSFAAEGVTYLETIETARFYRRADGSFFEADEVADIFRRRLQQPDARATGVTVRMQDFILRFLPSAESDLETSYRFVARNRDLYVAVNMVGREDNDKGYPLRFLPTMRELRQQVPGVNLSIHAGEVDEPNRHVRDTLLLGAQRIGHGVNLIDDPDTMLLMRHGQVLVEINLISNLLLGYVNDFSEHPFPEYLRTGIPVALSTDDRGMWDSNLTDEFYVAVKEFNLSWQEILSLGENSLQHAFVEDAIKQTLLENYRKRISAFSKRFKSKGIHGLDNVQAKNYSFTCKHYQVCF